MNEFRCKRGNKNLRIIPIIVTKDNYFSFKKEGILE